VGLSCSIFSPLICSVTNPPKLLAVTHESSSVLHDTILCIDVSVSTVLASCSCNTITNSKDSFQLEVNVGLNGDADLMG
jgi:hypothetical protein